MTQESFDFPVWQSIGDAISGLQVETETVIVKRADIRSFVAHAIAHDRVELVFQPISAAQHGRPVCFYEGLMRIRGADGALISPGLYLPEVEGTELAAALDVAALRQALFALRQNPWLRLSVNIAPQTMGHPDWLETLRRAADQAPDIAYRLIVEITESASLLDLSCARSFFATLRDLGCSVALDDFGAGTTSFRYFREYRFDIVKIDGHFCAGLATNADSRVLVKSLVDIAQHFEMLIVAEFIETEADAAAATALGVDCLQGYLIGRPDKALFDPWALRDTA